VSDNAKAKAALAAGEKLFVGKVCPRHPELEGQRRAKSRQCPACIRERMNAPPNRQRRRAARLKKYREDPEYRTRRLESKRKRRAMKARAQA
jgi:hypothetical protein